MLETVVGLDLSLNSAGLARYHLFDQKWDTRAITEGKHPDRPIWSRYNAVTKEVVKAVGQNDVVFIEDYAFGKYRSITTLAELGGIIRYMLWRITGHWPFPVSVGSLKKFATGSGSAKKEDIKLALYKKHHLEFKTNDEADALVLAQIGAVLVGLDCVTPAKKRRKWCGYELSVVQTLRKGLLRPREDELQSLAKRVYSRG